MIRCGPSSPTSSRPFAAASTCSRLGFSSAWSPSRSSVCCISPYRKTGSSLVGRRAGTFLSNAGVLQVFGVNDHDSARLVSDLLGQETVVFQTMSRALDAEKTGITYGEQHTARPLLTPDEVRNLPQNLELLFLAGQRPIVAGKLAYYADSEFRGLFDQA